MRTGDRAVPIGEHTQFHPFDSERLEPDADAHNIRNGIEGAHLMECHILGIKPMDAPFAHRDVTKHCDSLRLDELGEIAGLNHLTNLTKPAPVNVPMRMPVPMRMGILLRLMGRPIMNTEVHRSDPAAINLVKVHVKLAKACHFGKFPFKDRRGHAEIAQGSYSHVTADSRKTVEVKSKHAFCIVAAAPSLNTQAECAWMRSVRRATRLTRACRTPARLRAVANTMELLFPQTFLSGGSVPQKASSGSLRTLSRRTNNATGKDWRFRTGSRVAPDISPRLILLMVAMAFQNPSASAQPETSAAPRKESPRTWTNRDGRAFRATLESQTPSQVQLRMSDGRLVAMGLQNLSPSDQAYLSGDGEAVPRIPPEKRSWPQIVEVDSRTIEVAELAQVAGTFVYRSRSFEFTSQEKLSQAVLREIARTFESTRALIEALPWAVTPSPPGQSEFFEAVLYRSHEEYIASGAPEQSGGFYSNEDGIFRVPFESLGLRQRGKTWFMERNYSNAVIIHELTHQMMHDVLTFLPTWAIEGTAEYAEILPYNAGRFQAGQHRRAIKERATLWSRRGITPRSVGSLRELLAMPRDTWTAISQGGSREEQARLYFGALLLVYFFLHLDEDTTAFLRYLDAAHDDVRAWKNFYAQPAMQGNAEGYEYPTSRKPPENPPDERAALGRLDLLLGGRDEEAFRTDVIAAYRRIGIAW